MMKRKLSAGILAACMGAGLLAGCGGGNAAQSSGATGASAQASAASSSAATTKASSGGSGEAANMVFAWWGNQVRNENTQNAINLYMKENPNVQIEGQFSQWGDYWQKLATLSAGNNLPDIIQQDYAYVEQYTNSDQLYPLDEFVKDENIARLETNKKLYKKQIEWLRNNYLK